jgi:hypothetical protein
MLEAVAQMNAPPTQRPLRRMKSTQVLTHSFRACDREGLSPTAPMTRIRSKQELAAEGAKLIAPPKLNRRKLATQDGRTLRRARRRQKKGW